MCQITPHAGPAAPAALPREVLDLLPDGPAEKDALSLALSRLPASILNHSLRVFIYARAFHQDGGKANESADSVSALFVACVLHDIGTSTDYDTKPERFEVVGADEADRVLRSRGDVPNELIRDAWLAIALHTSPHIAERIEGLVRAVRLGVRVDFSSHPLPSPDYLPEHLRTKEAVESVLPRLEIEQELGDSIVRQALQNPDKAPRSSWPGGLLRSQQEDPEWDGVNKAF